MGWKQNRSLVRFLLGLISSLLSQHKQRAKCAQPIQVSFLPNWTSVYTVYPVITDWFLVSLIFSLPVCPVWNLVYSVGADWFPVYPIDANSFSVFPVSCLSGCFVWFPIYLLSTDWFPLWLVSSLPVFQSVQSDFKLTQWAETVFSSTQSTETGLQSDWFPLA